MVDLVKIRKKAKERKEAQNGSARLAPEPAPKGAPVAAAGSESAPERAGSPKVDGPAVSPGAERVESIAEEPEPAEEPDDGSAELPPTMEAPSPVAAAEVAFAEVQRSAPDPIETTLSAVIPSAPAAAEPEADVATAQAPAAPRKRVDKLQRFKEESNKPVARMQSTAMAEQAPADQAELLTFRIADEDYAVEIEQIVEIVPPRSATRVPNADESIIGIISLRGTIVTVLDLRRKLGHPSDTVQTADTRMIVVEHRGETAGFLVDRVSRVIKLDLKQLESAPVVSAAEQNDYLRGVFYVGTTLTILIDLERVLAH
jgi:purine-binding chemotaxis protein CheW